MIIIDPNKIKKGRGRNTVPQKQTFKKEGDSIIVGLGAILTPWIDEQIKEEIEMDKKDNGAFKRKLQELDNQLKEINDPEYAEYLILKFLGDNEDSEDKKKLEYYQLKFGG
jgi:hypothetical protein